MVKQKAKSNNKIKITVIILVVLFLISWFISTVISSFSEEISYGNVALIPVKGMITSDGVDFFSLATTSSARTVGKIEKAAEDDSIKAILFEINSPGGGAVSSEEIVTAIEELNKTTVAWIRETGASGAYWVAAATDYIFASKMSIVGGVGVLSSTLEFSKFLEDHNVTYNRLVAGEYKDITSPLKEMTDEEKQLLQAKIDLIHEYFLQEIVNLRNLEEDVEKEIDSGIFYIGLEALDLGLIDEIGTKRDVIKYLEEKLNTTVTIKSYEEKKSFFEILSSIMSEQSFHLGRGIATFLKDRGSIITT